MDFTAAFDFVAQRIAPDLEPCLSPEDITSLLSMVSDGSGEWSTVDCYRALAEGWAIRHGRAVSRFDFTTAGQTFRRSQMLDHIEDQRRFWARKVQASPSTLGRD